MIRTVLTVYVVSGIENWAKSSETGRKPWFCKSFQCGICVFQKDHDSNGKLHKHICAYCLSTGKQLGHAEKDCAHKKNTSKMTRGLPVIRAGQPKNVVRPRCEQNK